MYALAKGSAIHLELNTKEKIIVGLENNMQECF